MGNEDPYNPFTNPEYYEQGDEYQQHQQSTAGYCPGCGGPLDENGNCVSSMLILIGLAEAIEHYRCETVIINCFKIALLVAVIVVVLILVLHGMILPLLLR